MTTLILLCQVPVAIGKITKTVSGLTQENVSIFSSDPSSTGSQQCPPEVDGTMRKEIHGLQHRAGQYKGKHLLKYEIREHANLKTLNVYFTAC